MIILYSVALFTLCHSMWYYVYVCTNWINLHPLKINLFSQCMLTHCVSETTAGCARWWKLQYYHIQSGSNRLIVNAELCIKLALVLIPLTSVLSIAVFDNVHNITVIHIFPHWAFPDHLMNPVAASLFSGLMKWKSLKQKSIIMNGPDTHYWG